MLQWLKGGFACRIMLYRKLFANLMYNYALPVS